MSNQAWSEAVKTNNLEEHMLLDPLYYSFGDKEQKCWGVQVNVGGVQNMLGGCTNEVGGVRTPPHPPRKSASDNHKITKQSNCKVYKFMY